MVFAYFLLIIGLAYLLAKSSDMLADGLHRLHYRLKLNELLASFFFLGVITSIPEILVVVMSAARGVPELSLGNLLGAGIVVLTLLMGISAILAGGMSVEGKILKPDFLLSLGVMGLPLLFIFDGSLERWEGAILLLSFFILFFHFLGRRHLYEDRAMDEKGPLHSPIKEISRFLFAGAALLVVSHFLVDVSMSAALAWGVPAFTIGLLMISLGTNVPELAFVFKEGSPAGRREDITTGVLLGNVAVNTAALGLLGVLHPFEIADIAFVRAISLIFLLSLCAVGFFMLTKKRLSRVEGLALLSLYIVFIIFSLSRF